MSSTARGTGIVPSIPSAVEPPSRPRPAKKSPTVGQATAGTGSAGSGRRAASTGWILVAIPYPFRLAMAELGTEDNPLRVAIVGSGPAGFYAAEQLMKPEESAVEVDMFDKLPTPFGLVRAGVAPDHPKIKSVIRVYEKTAARPEFRFFGNVTIGEDITVDELRERYHAVLFAYGTSTDRQLGIPGEELPGSHSATEFVNWYNAHPDFADHGYDLACKRVVVIGNGNVAADVARMLALPREELEGTDTADHAIEALAESGVEEIVVLGRRGPAQAAFTNPEVRELGEMTQADIVIDPAEMELDEISKAYVESEDCDPTNRRNVEIFTEFSGREPEGKKQRIVLRFLSSPIEIKGDGKVESHRGRAQRAARGRVRRRARPRHRRARGDRVRPGAALHRLPRPAARPEHPLRRAPRRHLQRRRPRQDEDGAQVPGLYADRLDQARPLRRDRHQQEGLPGDDRRACSRTWPPARCPSPSWPRTRARSSACSASASPTTSPTRAGRRSTPPSRPPASRTAARASSSAASRRWSRPSEGQGAAPDGDRARGGPPADRGRAARSRGRGHRPDRHPGPPGGQVTAPQFEGLSRIEQHRLVKKACPGPLRRRLDPRAQHQDQHARRRRAQARDDDSMSAGA